VEKFLKGLLQEHDVTFPKTHDLKTLTDLAVRIDPTIKALQRRVHPLTRYAVEYRYPGLRANRRKSSRALEVAEQVRAEVRRRLGLRT
jgi:HEPN domain-containing protein